MKSPCASAILLNAAVICAENPVITVSLAESTEGVTFAHPSAHWNGATNAVNSNAGTAQTGMTDTATAAQTVTCLVGSTDTACPAPTVQAWDHHDGDISTSISECFKLINIGMPNTATAAQTGACEAAGSAAYTNMRNYRSEWIFTYDVTDRAGNAATTVTFSMVFVDNAPPAFTMNDQTSSQTTEARDMSVSDQRKFDRNDKRQKLNFKSEDVYDGDLTDQASITYTPPTAANVKTFLKSSTAAPAHHPHGDNTDTYYDVDTSDLGDHVFAISANDHAGIFGTNGVNNPSSFSWTLTVQDTTAPIITCNAAYCKKVLASTGAAIAVTSAASTDTWANDARTYVSFEAAGTDDATCCTACQTQARSRVIGTSSGPASCTHYTFSGSTCSLFSGSTSAGSVVVGVPMACNTQHGNEDWECGSAFSDYGAWCTDIYDGYSIDAVSSTAVTANAGSPDGGTKGLSSITYTCSDAATNAATAVTRSTSVRDTTPPTLAITTAGSHSVAGGASEDRLARYSKFGNAGRHAGAAAATQADWDTTLGAGSATYTGHSEAQLHGHALDSHVIQHSAGYLKDLAIIQNLRTYGEGMTCVDACDEAASVATAWSPTFNNIVPGTYVLKYTCKDASDHETVKERTVINEDKTKPVIRILGQDLMTLEATHDGNYVDDGATCSDQVDGMISENVEVSGDVVNLSTRGMYTISYNCKDSAGNAADTAIRIVYVVQTSCPTCAINGATELSREASFPYVDAGATCTDLLDATTPTGPTFNDVNVETTGTYKITYRVANVLGLYNDESTCRYGKMTYTRTVHVIDTLNPVITLKYNSVVVKTGLANDMALQSHASSPDLSAQINPADSTTESDNAHGPVNTQFMAETAQAASVNGWVVGAVGSAVTGLALLGYSMRKTSVATSVPV